MSRRPPNCNTRSEWHDSAAARLLFQCVCFQKSCARARPFRRPLWTSLTRVKEARPLIGGAGRSLGEEDSPSR
jgi:hypothetical protein